MYLQNFDDVMKEIERRLNTRRVYCHNCKKKIKFIMKWDNEQEDMYYECAKCGEETQDLDMSGEGLNF